MSNRRFEMVQYRHILVRMRLGESDRQIAAAGLMGRRTASKLRHKATQAGWLDPSKELPSDQALFEVLQRPKRIQARAQSSLEPYRKTLEAWHTEGIQGTTIYQALQRTFGYTGSYSSVRRFLQGLSGAASKVTTVLDFPPGDAAQVDFGQGPQIIDVHTGEVFKTWFFVMVLAWSRHQYAELVRDQSVETWLGCHRRAFEHFHGIPARVIIDNPKCAITKACYHDPQVQRAYADYAEGYGFLISPCPVADPQKKGRVESGVKYLKANFLPLRQFRSLADANRQLQDWVMGTAGNRIHGTTHVAPLSRFSETEQHLLRSLPDTPPECVRWAKAKLHGDCHIQFEKSRYSAPWKRVGQTLDVRASETTVRLYHHHELVATHPRATQVGQRKTVEEHLPPEYVAYKMRDPQWCLKQSKAIGPHCHALIERLFAHRVLDRLRAAQGVVRLGQRYGHQRLEAACQRALYFENIQYRTVRVILEKGLDQSADPEHCFDALSDTYTGAGRFGRNTRDLFNSN
jgi:transposase